LGKIKSIVKILDGIVAAPPHNELNIEETLRKYVNNCADNGSMKLQERNDAFQLLESALSARYVSGKRRVVYCYSPRGHGKTQFIKYFVTHQRANAMKCGRLIVRCCDRGGDGWVQQVLEGNVSEGFCEMIRTHVCSVTGRKQNSSHYSNPLTR
jgi:hypothetical protein